MIDLLHYECDANTEMIAGIYMLLMLGVVQNDAGTDIGGKAEANLHYLHSDLIRVLLDFHYSFVSHCG